VKQDKLNTELGGGKHHFQNVVYQLYRWWSLCAKSVGKQCQRGWEPRVAYWMINYPGYSLQSRTVWEYSANWEVNFS